MLTPGKSLFRAIHTGGHYETLGNFVYNKNTLAFWHSQRKAAKAMGISANVLSKHLSGKLPKLYV